MRIGSKLLHSFALCALSLGTAGCTLDQLEGSRDRLADADAAIDGAETIVRPVAPQTGVVFDFLDIAFAVAIAAVGAYAESKRRKAARIKNDARGLVSALEGELTEEQKASLSVVMPAPTKELVRELKK